MPFRLGDGLTLTFVYVHNRVRCIAAFLEIFETESDVFLPLDNLFSAGDSAQDSLVNAGG